MQKILGITALAGAMTFLISGAPEGFAQGKKKVESKAGTIEIIESKDGKYRFSVRDAEGTYLGGSAVGHATEAEARAAVEDLKKVLPGATFVRKKVEETKKEKK